MKVKHGVMDRGLDERLFRQRGRLCLTSPVGLISHFSQEEPFDLSQKAPGLASLCLSQSDGESIPGSSCQEEDEESLYRMSQYSPEVDQQEPSRVDQYISDLKEGKYDRVDELRTGKTGKLEKYLDSSEEESLEGEKKTQGQFGNERHLIQSESFYESDEEVDEKAYKTEKVHSESFDFDSTSEDECEESKHLVDGSYEAINVAEENGKSCEKKAD